MIRQSHIVPGAVFKSANGTCHIIMNKRNGYWGSVIFDDKTNVPTDLGFFSSIRGLSKKGMVSFMNKHGFTYHPGLKLMLMGDATPKASRKPAAKE